MPKKETPTLASRGSLTYPKIILSYGYNYNSELLEFVESQKLGKNRNPASCAIGSDQSTAGYTPPLSLRLTQTVSLLLDIVTHYEHQQGSSNV